LHTGPYTELPSATIPSSFFTIADRSDVRILRTLEEGNKRTRSFIRPFLLAFVVDRDFLKKLGARGRLSSYFHESTSPYNSTQKLYRVSHNTYLLLQGST
jgi:hypothetical protein